MFEIVYKKNIFLVIILNVTKENSIEILELQKEGKKKMKTSEYLKGNKLEIGSNVGKNL